MSKNKIARITENREVEIYNFDLNTYDFYFIANIKLLLLIGKVILFLKLKM